MYEEGNLSNENRIGSMVVVTGLIESTSFTDLTTFSIRKIRTVKNVEVGVFEHRQWPIAARMHLSPSFSLTVSVDCL